MVNNYCCDRTCLSQLYRHQDSTSNVSVVIQQGQILQTLLQNINTNYFNPLQSPNKLSGLSSKTYQDVIRFYFLYELLSGNSIYKRLVYDYHNASSTYILVDDSNLVTPVDFQVITFDRVTNFT